MQDELFQLLLRRLGKRTSVKLENLYLIPTDDSIMVRIAGQLEGRSVRQAIRQRAQIRFVVNQTMSELDKALVLVFDADDAAGRFEKLLLAILRSAVSPTISSVSLVDPRSEELGVTVAMDDIGNLDTSTVVSEVVRYVDLAAKAADIKISRRKVTVIVPPSTFVGLGQILRMLKVLQPATAATLFANAHKFQVQATEPKRIQNALDKARQDGLVVHAGGGLHALTARGINAAAVSVRRSSSDILRALELGKRKW